MEKEIDKEEKSALELLLEVIETLEEKQKASRECLEESLRSMRDCQAQSKQVVKYIKSYERDVSRRLKGVRNAEELLARLQKLVA